MDASQQFDCSSRSIFKWFNDREIEFVQDANKFISRLPTKRYVDPDGEKGIIIAIIVNHEDKEIQFIAPQIAIYSNEQNLDIYKLLSLFNRVITEYKFIRPYWNKKTRSISADMWLPIDEEGISDCIIDRSIEAVVGFMDCYYPDIARVRSMNEHPPDIM